MFSKEVFEQEYNDYAEGTIDAREFYKLFYFYMKFFQVLDGSIPKYTPNSNETLNQVAKQFAEIGFENIQHYIAKAIMLLCTLIALVCLSFSLYHGLETFDIPFLTEAGVYIIVLTYKWLMHLCAKLYVLDYHGMQRTTREDFLYICTRGERYRKRFFQHQINTRKMYKLNAIFCVGVVILMDIFSSLVLVYDTLKHEPGERTRPLLFPFWYFETDFGKSPLYEIAFTFSNFTVFIYGFNYSFMLGTQIFWMRQICCKADIIIWQIEDVMDGIRPTNDEREREAFDSLIRQRMREIVKHHNSMDILITQFARVYKKLWMYEQIASAPIVCLTAYAAAEKWDEGEFHAILILILIASTILVFIPSYMCTILHLQITSISYACWNIPFWNAGPMIRPYLWLIMEKSLRPLPFKVPGFDEFSVETFSKKMASAYSYFNMLRQANKN